MEVEAGAREIAVDARPVSRAVARPQTATTTDLEFTESLREKARPSLPGWHPAPI